MGHYLSEMMSDAEWEAERKAKEKELRRRTNAIQDQIDEKGPVWQKFVFLMDQNVKGKGGMLRPAIKAWIYIGMPDFWTGIPLTKVSPKGPDGKKFYEWSVPRKTSALKYAPKSTVMPETSVETSRMWDMHYEGDDLFDQEVDWALYDQAMRDKEFAKGDSLPPFDI